MTIYYNAELGTTTEPNNVQLTGGRVLTRETYRLIESRGEAELASFMASEGYYPLEVIDNPNPFPHPEAYFEWEYDNTDPTRPVRRKTWIGSDELTSIEYLAKEKLDRSVEIVLAGGFEVVLPAGATIDGEPAEGVVVNCDFEPTEHEKGSGKRTTRTDWKEFGVRLATRFDKATEKFDSWQGRVAIPGIKGTRNDNNPIRKVVTAISVRASDARTAGNDLYSLWEAAETIEDYQVILDALSWMDEL